MHSDTPGTFESDMDGTFKVPQSAERRTSAKIIKSSERRKCIKLSAVLFMQVISLNYDLAKCLYGNRPQLSS